MNHEREAVRTREDEKYDRALTKCTTNYSVCFTVCSLARISLIGLVLTWRTRRRPLVKASEIQAVSPREIKSRCKFRPERPGRKEQTRRRRKQFPWNIPSNEWRPEDRTTSRESIPIVTFIFVPFSLFRDFPLSSPLIPPTSSADLRALLGLSVIDRRSFASEKSPRRSFPSILSSSATRIPWRGFSRLFRNFRNFTRLTTRWIFSWDESRENRKCNLTVDYARKITSDGPSTVVSIEYVHSKCIGSLNAYRYTHSLCMTLSGRRATCYHFRSLLTERVTCDLAI